MRYSEEQVRALLAAERTARREYDHRLGVGTLPKAKLALDAAEVEVEVMRIMVAQQAGGAG